MKNKREVLQALLEGKTIHSRYDEAFVKLDENGEALTRIASGDFEKGYNWTFGTPEHWEIFKEKKKVVVVCYGLVNIVGTLINLSYNPLTPVSPGIQSIKFEKEIEVDE